MDTIVTERHSARPISHDQRPPEVEISLSRFLTAHGTPRPYQIRIPISICTWHFTANSDDPGPLEVGSGASFTSPNRCRPNFCAPEIAETKIVSRAVSDCWPSSKSMMAACRLAMEPQKIETSPFRHRKACALQVLECKSVARRSSTSRVKGVDCQHCKDGLGWKASPSTSYTRCLLSARDDCSIQQHTYRQEETGKFGIREPTPYGHGLLVRRKT